MPTQTTGNGLDVSYHGLVVSRMRRVLYHDTLVSVRLVPPVHVAYNKQIGDVLSLPLFHLHAVNLLSCVFPTCYDKKLPVARASQNPSMVFIVWPIYCKKHIKGPISLSRAEVVRIYILIGFRAVGDSAHGRFLFPPLPRRPLIDIRPSALFFAVREILSDCFSFSSRECLRIFNGCRLCLVVIVMVACRS